MAGYKDATRRAFVGPRAVIQCISKGEEEYWIRPRKLSSGVADEIAELQRAYLRENRESIRGYREFEARLKSEGKTLEQADSLELLNFVPHGDPGMRPAIYRLAFADGIGEHNLVGDDGKTIGGGKCLDKAAIEFIVSWDPLAIELFAIIQQYNLPLPSGSGAISSTPPNGPSSESSSPKAPSSPMDGSPQS
jgi:hypothetical protein